MILIFFVTVLVIQVALIVVELIQMRIEKFSKPWIIRLISLCRKSNKIHPSPSPDDCCLSDECCPTGNRRTRKRFTDEEEDEMVEQFSFIFDWILFGLATVGIIV